MSFDDQIQKIFEAAGLSDDERELWLSRLVANERLQTMFVDTFTGDAELIRFFTSDLRERISAGNDEKKLTEVLEKEREYFHSLLSQSKTE